jgi:hypothetical protein
VRILPSDCGDGLVGIGPGAGRLVADMVADGPTLVDPAPFRLGRFTDGSKLAAAPARQLRRGDGAAAVASGRDR